MYSILPIQLKRRERDEAEEKRRKKENEEVAKARAGERKEERENRKLSRPITILTSDLAAPLFSIQGVIPYAPIV